MQSRNMFLGGASVLVAWLIFLIWLWKPEHQVRLHQRHFLSALEDRNWDRVRALLGDNYSDRWQHDKEFVLRECREVFRQFLAVQVTGEISDVDMVEGSAEVKTTLEMRGRGGPVAEYAVTRVNAIHSLWVFGWERQSWKPWDWALVKVDNPDLELSVP